MANTDSDKVCFDEHMHDAEKGIKLSCGCLEKNKKELHNSIIRYCIDVLDIPLIEVSRRAELNNKRTLIKSVASMFKVVFKSKDYDYELMIKGLLSIFTGIGILIISCIIGDDIKARVDRFRHTVRHSRHLLNDYELFLILSSVLFFVAILVGVLYILKPTQILFHKKDWELDEKRFIYAQPVAPVISCIFAQDNKNVEKTDEMILYNNKAQFYFGEEVISLTYSEMEGIFETENFFVVMIRNNYIYSFQKCDMRQEVEQQVRKVLSPYYKTVSEA